MATLPAHSAPLNISLPSRPTTSCPLTLPQLIESIRSVDAFDRMFAELSPQGYREIINTIMRKLKYRNLSMGTVVYSKGDNTSQIYFVVTGLVAAVVGGKQNKQQIRQYRALQGFGEAEAISHCRRIFTTVTKEDSYLAILRPGDFAEVLADYRNKVYIKKLIRFQDNYLLSRFSKSQMEVLVHSTQQAELQRNQVLYEENSPSNELYLVVKGEVRLVKASMRGAIDICTLYEGELVGQVELILNESRQSSAICVSETLLVYIVDRKIFMSQLSPYNLNELLPSIQTKHEQRTERFERYNDARRKGDNPLVKYCRVNQLLNKERKVVQLRGLADRKLFGDPFTRQVVSLVSKKRKLASKYPNPLKDSLGRYKLFDLSDELRPKILHRREWSQLNTPKVHPASTSLSPHKKTLDIAEGEKSAGSMPVSQRKTSDREKARKMGKHKRSNTEISEPRRRVVTELGAGECIVLPPIRLKSQFSLE